MTYFVPVIFWTFLILCGTLINTIIFSPGYAQFQTEQSTGDIEEELKLAQEKVKSAERVCEDYFNTQISARPPGYLRYVDELYCFNIDYPSTWSVSNYSLPDNNSLKGDDVILTDTSDTHPAA